MPWPAEVSEWWAQCVRAGYERQKQIAPEVVAYREIQELIAERDQLRATLAERKASFDLRWNADMRAIKRWQAAHPDQKRTWPDHADLCVWLLEQDDELRATIARQAEELERVRKDAERYRWLRNDALMKLQSGPICVAADKWGNPLTQHPEDDPGLGPALHITLDGKELDAAIDSAIAKERS